MLAVVVQPFFDQFLKHNKFLEFIFGGRPFIYFKGFFPISSLAHDSTYSSELAKGWITAPLKILR